MIKFKYENIKLKKKECEAGYAFTSKLSDKIIKRPSISHETITVILKSF
jgi:hypothetical protein